MQWSSELHSPIPVYFSSLIPKVSIFILTISCLTTSNLRWFMDLTFQVPMQYCSLQPRILLSSPDTSTTEHHFHFGPAASFFLGLLVLLLHSSPVAYWTPDLRYSPFGVISFCPYIQFMGFSWQVYYGGLPFPSPVDHILSELSTITCPSWVTLQGMVHSFIELCKILHHNKAVIHEGVLGVGFYHSKSLKCME